MDKQYNDKCWAITFLLHCGIVLLLVFALGIPALRKGKTKIKSFSQNVSTFLFVLSTCLVTGTSSDEEDDEKDDDDDATIDVNFGDFFGVMMATLVLSITFASLFIYVIGRFPHVFVQVSVLMALVGSFIAFIVVGAVSHHWGPATVILGIPFIFLTCWYFCVRKRIPYAAATLEVASNVLSTYKACYCLAFGAIIIGALWYFLEIIAFAGLADKSGNAGIVILFLVSLYWSIQVLYYVVSATVAGTVGHWWTLPSPMSVPKKILHD